MNKPQWTANQQTDRREHVQMNSRKQKERLPVRVSAAPVAAQVRKRAEEKRGEKKQTGCEQTGSKQGAIFHQ